MYPKFTCSSCVCVKKNPSHWHFLYHGIVFNLFLSCLSWPFMIAKTIYRGYSVVWRWIWNSFTSEAYFFNFTGMLKNRKQCFFCLLHFLWFFQFLGTACYSWGEVPITCYFSHCENKTLDIFYSVKIIPFEDINYIQWIILGSSWLKI